MFRVLSLLPFVFLLAAPAFAQLLAHNDDGVFVAHEGTAIAVSAHRVAVVDALNDTVTITDTATDKTTRHTTRATPIAAAFVGDEVYVLARDARVLQRIGGPEIAVATDPAFVRVSNGRLYVYSRATGTLEEIANDRVARRVRVQPFASDFEVAGNTAYLTYPRDARIRIVNLATMKLAGELAVGAVPVDLALAGGGSAITARILAVADPSAKRVWLTEATQSTAEAVARGFLRGFLGLGLFGNRASEFPTGVDRVLVDGKRWVAYDTSSGTLYAFTRDKSTVLARNVPAGAFTLTGDGVAWWNGTSVAQRTLR